MSEKSGLADPGLTGQKINTAAGKAWTKDSVKLADAGGEGIPFFGSKGIFDGEGLSWLGRGFFTAASLGFEERSSFDEGVPLMTGRTLAGPFGKLVAAAVAEKDGGGFTHICIMYQVLSIMYGRGDVLSIMYYVLCMGIEVFN